MNGWQRVCAGLSPFGDINASYARELHGDDFSLPAYRGGLLARLARTWHALTGQNLEWKHSVAIRERNEWRDRALYFERIANELRQGPMSKASDETTPSE